MQVTKKFMFTIYIYQIDVYWSENEKNGLNNGKMFKVKMLYFKFELKQLRFKWTHELHN
jgi:hypothetical protein